MHHDHDLGAGPQGLRVARLLVGAVAVVAVVDEDLQAELPGDFEGRIGGAVVDQYDEVHGVFRQLLVGQAERPPGVVGGHHDDDLGLAARRAHQIPGRSLAPFGWASTVNW